MQSLHHKLFIKNNPMKILIITIFFTCGSLFAQDLKTDSLISTSKEFSETNREKSPSYYNIKNFDFLMLNDDFNNLQIKFDENLKKYYSNNFLYLNTQIDPIELSQQNFYDNLNQLRNWNENKYNLGLVGNILKYTMGAAAVGLAGYHIYKYYIKKEE